MIAAPLLTYRVIIKGRVQGVWYRGWTRDKAQSLGLSGWVRNRRDAEVEAIFSGPADKVAEMLEACRSGPPAAKVIDIVTSDAEAPPNQGFIQLPSI